MGGIALARPTVTNSSQTIDRRVVHRAHVHEVLITDVTGDDGWFLAQVPSSHGYFCDGPSATSAIVDALALMEACRQAGTAAAHLFWGVPHGTQFVLTRWQGNFPIASRPRFGNGPVDLCIHVSLDEPRRLRGELTGGTTRVRVYSASEEELLVGTLDLDVRYVRNEVYLFLRTGARGGSPVPTSTTRIPDAEGALPSQVGRTREENVAIGRVSLWENRGEAALRLPYNNRSMFDHAQDHAPAMVLVEAARQLVHASCSTADPGRTVLVGIDGDFGTYVELDAPTQLRVVQRPDLEAFAQATAEVEIHQSQKLAAKVALAFDTLRDGYGK